MFTSFFLLLFPENRMFWIPLIAACATMKALKPNNAELFSLSTRADYRLYVPHGSTDVAELIAVLDSRYLKNNMY